MKVTLEKDNDNEKGICFHRGKKGHWKRNCRKYLNEKAQREHGNASSIYMIDTYLCDRDSISWVLDIGCGS